MAQTGSVRFVSMNLSPGFTYQQQSTSDGVKVTFTRTSTGEQREWRVEPGRTVVR